jgi:hypothetical protein
MMCEGRRRASPKGGNRGAELRLSAVAMSYGDLNGGSRPGKLDGGTSSEIQGARACLIGSAGSGYRRMWRARALEIQGNDNGRSCQPGSMKRRRGT